jgi:hypothetical protein
MNIGLVCSMVLGTGSWVDIGLDNPLPEWYNWGYLDNKQFGGVQVVGGLNYL